MRVFKEEVFKGKMWSIAPQQPPNNGHGDLRRVDLVPEHSDVNGALARVLFCEAKRANAIPSDLETVEFEASTACCAYLYYFGKQSVWAVNAFAGKASDDLTPWVPKGDGIGAPDEYVEAHSSDGHLILDQLKYIREHREPKSNVPSSPRPANAGLPVSWYDTEVELVAGPLSLPRTQGTGTIIATQT